MFQNRLFVETLVAYLAAGVCFGLEEIFLSRGSQWSFLPPTLFVVLFVWLLVNSKRSGLFLLFATPAHLIAEKQLLLIFFMAIPYLFDSNL